MTKIDWVRKLTSRKFWIAVAGLVTGIITFVKQPTTDAQTITALILALGSVVAYCIGEGLADAANVQPEVEVEPTVLYIPTDELFDKQAAEIAEKAEKKEEGGEE